MGKIRAQIDVAFEHIDGPEIPAEHKHLLIDWLAKNRTNGDETFIACSVHPFNDEPSNCPTAGSDYQIVFGALDD